MIDPISALVGGPIGGAALGLFSDLVRSYFSNKLEHAKILRGEQNDINEAQLKYQVELAGKHPPYYGVIMLVACTVCLATLYCFLVGDIPVITQGFKANPTETSVAFGLWKRVSPDQNVYLLTFAGLGTYFMAGLLFVLTSVTTGVFPKRGI